MERSATRAPERSYRLLVVDDDEVDRRNYSRLLTGQAPGACDIRHAADGATGLAALHAERFDCVLLDLNLPDMTGLEFLAAASDDGKLPCAIILITGYGNETVAVEAMKCGIQDYLVKDRVNASNLWRAMTTAVTQTALRQRLASSMHGLTAANAALENEVIVRKAVEVELRAAKEAAEQANQAKTRFVATVTHELRTPLNGILGYAQLLCIEGGLSAGQEARVGAMMQAGRHLLEMIQGVLDFASIETGQLVLRPVPVAVRELAERCIAFVRPMAGKHALGLRMVVGPDAPRQISTDPTRLRQVLLNLLGNAVKYTTAGSVELRLLDGATQGGLRIEIADTGPGIDAANRDRLFQDFERLSAVTSVEGAGLGLAIAARIVGVMNGSIGHVDNPGGGSVFWLDLPTAGTVPLLSDAVPAAQSPAALRVLAVDDVAINRDVVHGFLRAAGHEVWLAGSGQDAIRLAGERTFDLILMDVRMPGMDGLEATRRIRSLPGPRGQVPILALSAYSMLSQIEDFRNAGMNGHVEKPVDQATLMSAIGDAVASERQDRLEGRHSWNSIEIAPEKRHPPRFDRELFDTVLGFRQSDEVAARLKSLHSRMEEMSRLLEAPTLPGVLGEAAHRLASTAGTFGFVALSVVARSFERATVRGSPDLVQLTQQVSMEARAALAILDEVMCERRMLPA